MPQIVVSITHDPLPIFYAKKPLFRAAFGFQWWS
jgi:hypothetical protein